jgi:hypothetical protein
LGLILEAYLCQAGFSTTQLVESNRVVNELVRIGANVRSASDDASANRVLKEELRKTTFPAKFCLPLGADEQFLGFNIDKCKVLTSNARSRAQPFSWRYPNPQPDM